MSGLSPPLGDHETCTYKYLFEDRFPVLLGVSPGVGLLDRKVILHAPSSFSSIALHRGFREPLELHKGPAKNFHVMACKGLANLLGKENPPASVLED